MTVYQTVTPSDFMNRLSAVSSSRRRWFSQGRVTRSPAPRVVVRLATGASLLLHLGGDFLGDVLEVADRRAAGDVDLLDRRDHDLARLGVLLEEDPVAGVAHLHGLLA